MRNYSTRHTATDPEILSRIDGEGGASACWPWLLHTNSDGYGQFTRRQKKIKAHRWAYEYFRGPIPKGHVVCHRCDNPRCCNPHHLFLGTQDDNVADMHRKGRAICPGNAQQFDAQQIRQLRSKGLSQQAIAEIVGCSQRTVSSYLRKAGSSF